MLRCAVVLLLPFLLAHCVPRRPADTSTPASAVSGGVSRFGNLNTKSFVRTQKMVGAERLKNAKKFLDKVETQEQLEYELFRVRARYYLSYYTPQNAEDDREPWWGYWDWTREQQDTHYENWMAGISCDPYRASLRIIDFLYFSPEPTNPLLEQVKEICAQGMKIDFYGRTTATSLGLPSYGLVTARGLKHSDILRRLHGIRNRLDALGGDWNIMIDSLWLIDMPRAEYDALVDNLDGIVRTLVNDTRWKTDPEAMIYFDPGKSTRVKASSDYIYVKVSRVQDLLDPPVGGIPLQTGSSDSGSTSSSTSSPIKHSKSIMQDLLGGAPPPRYSYFDFFYMH